MRRTPTACSVSAIRSATDCFAMVVLLCDRPESTLLRWARLRGIARERACRRLHPARGRTVWGHATSRGREHEEPQACLDRTGGDRTGGDRTGGRLGGAG